MFSFAKNCKILIIVLLTLSTENQLFCVSSENITTYSTYSSTARYQDYTDNYNSHITTSSPSSSEDDPHDKCFCDLDNCSYIPTTTNKHFLENYSYVAKYYPADTCHGNDLIAFPNRKFLVDYVDCVLCPMPYLKNNIVTAGTVNVSTPDLSPTEALAKGRWYGYKNNQTIDATIPLKVLLNDHEEFVENVSVPIGQYHVVLIGKPYDFANEYTSDVKCDSTTYKHWGLVNIKSLSMTRTTVCINWEKLWNCCRSDVSPTSSTKQLHEDTTTSLNSTDTTTIASADNAVSTKSTDSTTTPPKQTTNISTNYACEVNCSILIKSDKFIVCLGEAVEEPCPENHVGKITHACGGESGDYQIVSTDHCRKAWIEDVENMIANETKSAAEIIDVIRNNTLSTEAIKPKELQSVITSLNNLTNFQRKEITYANLTLNDRIMAAKKYVDGFVSATSNLIHNRCTWELLNKTEQESLGPSLLLQLEDTGWLLEDQVGDDAFIDFDFNTEQIYLKVQAFESEKIKKEGGIEFQDKDGKSKIQISSESISSSLDASHTFKSVAFLVKFEAANRTLPGHFTNLEAKTKTICTEILNFSIKKRRGNAVANLQQNAKLVFKNKLAATGPEYVYLHRDQRPDETPAPVLNTAKCVYWDVRNNIWSSEGCAAVSQSSTETVCSCNHLTMFAVITDVHGYIGRDQILDTVGLVLTTLSCISVIITFCILQCSSESKAPRIQITKQLCFSLGLLYLSLGLFLDRDFLKLDEAECIAVAAVLHFIALSSVFWMLAQGIYLIQIISKVLPSTHTFIEIYWFIGYGIPVLIVAITLITTYGINGWSNQNAYSFSNYCWLMADNCYIWTFAGPLATVVIFNTIVLNVAIKSAFKLKINQEKELPEKIKLWTKGMLSLNCILGPTWIFGFMYINKMHYFAYLFTILNASQGIMILIFQCLINDRIRGWLLEKFGYSDRYEIQETFPHRSWKIFRRRRLPSTSTFITHISLISINNYESNSFNMPESCSKDVKK